MNKFIGEIIKREKDKPQGKHKRFVTKKVIVCTHYDTLNGQQDYQEDHEIRSKGIEFKDVSAITNYNVQDVFKYMIEQLTLDPNIEEYEKDIWEKTTSKLEEKQKEKTKEQGGAGKKKEGDDEDAYVLNPEDILEMQLKEIEGVKKPEKKTGLSAFLPF